MWNRIVSRDARPTSIEEASENPLHFLIAPVLQCHVGTCLYHFQQKNRSDMMHALAFFRTSLANHSVCCMMLEGLSYITNMHKLIRVDSKKDQPPLPNPENRTIEKETKEEHFLISAFIMWSNSLLFCDRGPQSEHQSFPSCRGKVKEHHP